MSKKNAIEVHNLTKKYKGKAEPALNNISMNIPYGSIFGLHAGIALRRPLPHLHLRLEEITLGNRRRARIVY